MGRGGGEGGGRGGKVGGAGGGVGHPALTASRSISILGSSVAPALEVKPTPPLP